MFENFYFMCAMNLICKILRGINVFLNPFFKRWLCTIFLLLCRSFLFQIKIKDLTIVIAKLSIKRFNFSTLMLFKMLFTN